MYQSEVAKDADYAAEFTDLAGGTRDGVRILGNHPRDPEDSNQLQNPVDSFQRLPGVGPPAVAQRSCALLLGPLWPGAAVQKHGLCSGTDVVISIGCKACSTMVYSM